MSYCHVSRQIDEHIHGEMVVDAFHQAINRRIEQLTAKGSVYYPFSVENIGEALGALNESQEKVLAYSLENGADNIGGMIAAWVSQYWQLQAEKKAIKEMRRNEHQNS